MDPLNAWLWSIMTKISAITLHWRQEITCHPPALLGYHGIYHDQCRHRLDDRDSPGYNAGIVSALGRKNALFRTVVGRCCLGNSDRSWGLECNLEVYWSPIGNPTLDSCGIVRLGGELRPWKSRPARAAFSN